MSDTKRAKPRGLYYADSQTRKRVALAGGLARADKYKKQKEELALQKALDNQE
jgi:hypothetical protein